MNRQPLRVAVVGATSWGTTLAIHLAKLGHNVALWARTLEEAHQLQLDGENRRFLPGFPFPPALRATASLDEAFSEATLALFVVPSKTIRQNAQRVREALREDTVIVSATKGLEMSTGMRMTQVLQEELPRLHSRICALSGPNLSAEVAKGLPTSTVIACHDEALAKQVQLAFMSPWLRAYTNVDVIGVELAGALKNIIALGAGIGDGLGYGNNSKAAFITRGLAEIARLGVAAGANPLTFAGLAGLGDLVATAASPLSRNRYVGEELAKGRSLGEILSGMRNVAEGVDTTAAAMRLARDLGGEMPITQATYSVLFEGLPPQKAVAALMERAPQPEWLGVLPG